VHRKSTFQKHRKKACFEKRASVLLVEAIIFQIALQVAFIARLGFGFHKRLKLCLPNANLLIKQKGAVKVISFASNRIMLDGNLAASVNDPDAEALEQVGGDFGVDIGPIGGQSNGCTTHGVRRSYRRFHGEGQGSVIEFGVFIEMMVQVTRIVVKGRCGEYAATLLFRTSYGESHGGRGRGRGEALTLGDRGMVRGSTLTRGWHSRDRD